MKTPLDNLIRGGKRLLANVHLHYQQNPNTLPPDQQVTVVELDAWYRGVETALEKAFGTDSHEMRTWHDRKKQIREQEWENIARTRPLRMGCGKGLFFNPPGGNNGISGQQRGFHT
jgi:hypothetical protein